MDNLGRDLGCVMLFFLWGFVGAVVVILTLVSLILAGVL